MAVELYRALDCVEYSGSEPRVPALPVTIKEPVRGVSKSLLIPVDTGFAGYILVDRETYHEIGTAEVPKENFGVYRTLIGQIILRRAHVIVKVGQHEFETYVETPMYGVGKLLLGRRILSKLSIGLFGTREMTCFLHPSK